MSSDLESASGRASAVSGEDLVQKAALLLVKLLMAGIIIDLKNIYMAEMIRCGISHTAGSLYCFEELFCTLELHVYSCSLHRCKKISN